MQIIINIFTSLPTIFSSALAQGLLWAFLALGVYLTFRILDVADLTTEGSFPLGGAIAALVIFNDGSPIIGTLLAFIGGMLAGLVSGLMHTKLKIPALLAGIITMTGLYSINARVMQQKPQIPLNGKKTVFTYLENTNLSRQTITILVGFIVLIILVTLLVIFFRTEIGLSVIATGDNLNMSQANGINTDSTKIIGYMLANGCIALSGALIAQNNNFADLNAGVGTIVIGLASIIIAEVIFANQPLLNRFITIVIGAVIYRFILGIILELPIEATDNKLFSALILMFCLALPLVKEKFTKRNRQERS